MIQQWKTIKEFEEAPEDGISMINFMQMRKASMEGGGYQILQIMLDRLYNIKLHSYLVTN